MKFLEWYLSVSAAIYLICLFGDAINGFQSFKKATVMDCLRGIAGVLIWPYIILMWKGDT